MRNSKRHTMMLSLVLFLLCPPWITPSHAQHLPATPAQPAPKPAQEGPVLCYNEARQSNLSDDQALRLCSGWNSAGPAKCYQAAHSRTTLSTTEALRLCRCATGTEPVQCVLQAQKDTTLDRSRSIGLCQNAGKSSLDILSCRPDDFYGASLGYPG